MQEIGENETYIAFNPSDVLLKLDHIRRNHALEHATLHLIVASGRQKKRVAGYSDLSGFWLIGDISTEEVEKNAIMALNRLRGGESRLAVHPQCGTNYAVTALLGSFGVLLSLIGIKEEKASVIDRLPLIWLVLVVSNFFGPILGKKVQERVTTNPNPGELTLGAIKRIERGGLILHHVRTHSDKIEGGLCRLIWQL